MSSQNADPTLPSRTPNGQGLLGELDALAKDRSTATTQLYPTVDYEVLSGSMRVLNPHARVSIVRDKGRYTLPKSQLVGMMKTVVRQTGVGGVRDAGNISQVEILAPGVFFTRHGDSIMKYENGKYQVYAMCLGKESTHDFTLMHLGKDGWMYMHANSQGLVQGIGRFVRKHLVTGVTEDLGLISGGIYAMSTNASGDIFIAGYNMAFADMPHMYNSAIYGKAAGATTWTVVHHLSSTFSTIEVANDGSLYVSGYFTSIGGVAAHRVAKCTNPLDAGLRQWHPMAGGLDEPAFNMTSGTDGRVYAFGWFSNAVSPSLPLHKVAMWKDDEWHELAGGSTGPALGRQVWMVGNDFYASIESSSVIEFQGGVHARWVVKWNAGEGVWENAGDLEDDNVMTDRFAVDAEGGIIDFQNDDDSRFEIELVYGRDGFTERQYTIEFEDSSNLVWTGKYWIESRNNFG